MSNNNQKNTDWLIFITALLSFGMLWASYYLFKSATPPWSFLTEMIPDIGSGIFNFIVIYLFFTRVGIGKNNKLDFIDERTTTILSKVNAIDSHVLTLVDGLGCVEKFNETFNDADWKRLIDNSEKEIVLVIYYFDGWLKINEANLISFLRKPDTKLTIVMADPNISTNIDFMKKLFPEKGENSLKEKIKNTQDRAAKILYFAGASTSRLKIYFSQNPLSYSMQLFDENKVALSFFEIAREHKINSPVFLLNLNSSEKTKSFIKKELVKLISNSSLV